MIAKMQPLPLHNIDERLCIGIDISKASHVAAFVSGSLLDHYKRYLACPTLAFPNSRLGFEQLVQTCREYAPLSKCTVILEKTGHYGNALAEYLAAQGIEIYQVHIQKRMGRYKNEKSDKRDAQRLANTLYNQISLGAQPITSENEVHRLLPPSETATKLRGLVRHQYELVQEISRRKNKITAIVDELFPELTIIFRSLFGDTAMNVLERFETPADIAAAPFDQIKACRTWRNPSTAKLLQLQELARTTIGIQDAARVESLTFEKAQLLKELRLLIAHDEALDEKITAIVEKSREGKILQSLGIISPSQAGAIIATIGTIASFEKPSKLKAFFGWCPVRDQTGTSRDLYVQTKGGNRLMKKTMYLISWQAIRQDTEWRETYNRLVKKKCVWDERRQDYKGKNKIIARVIGDIITMIFFLLRRDYDLLAALQPGEEPPPPMLYDRTIHRNHRRRQSQRNRGA